MSFLDNSGDIILDAVLTDTGRYRLAKGDGSFKITKFALGDDEIDYNLYDKNHPSGSAYYDLNILQTPVLEAFTDNASALKSHLLTIQQTDLLFLPVVKLFEGDLTTQTYNGEGYFMVAVDSDTENYFDEGGVSGLFFTVGKRNTQTRNIQLHQGLDTIRISPTQECPRDLTETIYLIEMDNRLGMLLNENLTEVQRSYIDDDQIATYIISKDRNSDMVQAIERSEANNIVNSSIQGPRGTKLMLRLASTMELQVSTFLFEELGSVVTIGADDFYYIDSNIRITGATTGYRIDVPVRFMKYKQP